MATIFLWQWEIPAVRDIFQETRANIITVKEQAKLDVDVAYLKATYFTLKHISDIHVTLQ